ncbi:MAG: zinc ribbon domain-containing protein [Blautia sp.]|nr:zinc ribbon domain-containing protein [Blautia sp.]
MYCKNCGKELRDGWKICPYCRNPIVFEDRDKDTKNNFTRINTKQSKKNVKKNSKKKEPQGKIVVGAILFFLVISFIARSMNDSVKNNADIATEKYEEENIQMAENDVYTNEYIDNSPEQSSGENYSVDYDDMVTERELKLSSILSNSIWCTDYFGNYISELYEIEPAFSKCMKKAKKLLERGLKLETGGEWQYVYERKEKYTIVDNSDRANYIYQGEYKNDMPHGFGIIYDVVSKDKEGNPIMVPIYIGEFEKGKYNGDGIKYYSRKELDNDVFLRLLAEFNDMQNAANNYFNYMKYIGEFNDSKESGTGVHFLFPDYESSMACLLENEEQLIEIMGFNDLVIRIGEFKKGKENGNIKAYVRNKLRYKGEMKKGQYDGKGTLYTETGEIEYSGKWQKGEMIK